MDNQWEKLLQNCSSFKKAWNTGDRLAGDISEGNPSLPIQASPLISLS
jgi:hypothetical protein